MSKMLASTVTAAIAAARPTLLETRGDQRAIDTRPKPAARLHSVKIVPIPRVRLDVTLPLERGEAPDAKLHAFMQCGLAAYAADIQLNARHIVIELNLARDDIGFAFHTLIAQLPEAMIGPICVRA